MPYQEERVAGSRTKNRRHVRVRVSLAAAPMCPAAPATAFAAWRMSHSTDRERCGRQRAVTANRRYWIATVAAVVDADAGAVDTLVVVRVLDR